MARRIRQGDQTGGQSLQVNTSSNVRVTIRVRPENNREIEAASSRNVVQVLDDQVLIFDPKVENSPGFYQGRKRRGRDIMKRKNRDIQYMFDHVFSPGVANSYVYECTTLGILDGLLNGYNCSVFAYGATGAGKTHTMLGSTNNPGIVFMTMMELYDRMEAIKHEKICDIAVSYLEVYNEQIHDLLMPSGNLPIREDPQKGVIVAGLSLHKPSNAKELLHMLEFGNKNRTQHPTDANAESSRSHAVFQVFVKQRDKTANISADIRIAKMLLVDLAGSERATVTTNRGMRFREGANINRSLLALGNCINALADGKRAKYIPYRNSKLTRLLKDSLGGNCKTVMIAAVSPSSLSFEDTYNTLQYAGRAKNIKTNLKRNVMNVDFHVSQYATIVKELRQEVTDLKAKLQVYETNTSLQQVQVTATMSTENNEFDRLEMIMTDVFQQRIGVRKELLELESSYKIVSYKISRKERQICRIKAAIGDTGSTDNNGKILRLEEWISSSKKNRSNMQTRKLSIEARIKENQDWLNRVEADTTKLQSQGCQLTSDKHHMEVELFDTRRQVKHLKKLSRAQNREAQTSERLVIRLIETARRQYNILKANKLVTTELEWQYRGLEQQLQEDRDVAWADESMADGELGVTNEFDQLLDLPVFKYITGKTPARTPTRAMLKSNTPRRTPRSSGRKRRGRKTLNTTVETKEVSAKSFGVDSAANTASPVLPPKGDLLPSNQASTTDLKSSCDAGHTPYPKRTPPKDSPIPDIKPNTTCNQIKQSIDSPPQIEGRISVPTATSSNHDLNETFDAAAEPNIKLPHVSENVDETYIVNSHIVPNKQMLNCTKNISNQPSDSTYIINAHPLQHSQHSTFSNASSHNSLKSIDVNNRTVTKSTKNIATHVETEGQKGKKSVVRSMDFTSHQHKENCPSPAGPLTFSEVVQSPGVAEQFRTLPSETRSPLTPKENLPVDHNAKEKSKDGRKLFKVPRDVENQPPRHHKSTLKRHHSDVTSSKVTQYLHRHGLPSMVSTMKHADGERPSYMQPTRAVMNRHKGNRNESPEEFDRRQSLAVGRVRLKENRHQPSRNESPEEFDRRQSLAVGRVPLKENRRQPSRTLSQGKPSFNWIKKSSIF